MEKDHDKKACVQRVINVPIKEVWEACTDMNQINEWVMPEEFTKKVLEWKMKPGHYLYFINGPCETSDEHRIFLQTTEKFERMEFLYSIKNKKKNIEFEVEILLKEEGKKTDLRACATFKTKEALMELVMAYDFMSMEIQLMNQLQNYLEKKYIPEYEGLSKGEKVLAVLKKIELEMKKIGFWSKNPPQFEVGHYLESPSFELWIQCVLIPNAKKAVQDNDYPSKSQVGLMAMRQYDYHDYIPQAKDLLKLLYQFDKVVEAD